jgi:hypothetical protein
VSYAIQAQKLTIRNDTVRQDSFHLYYTIKMDTMGTVVLTDYKYEWRWKRKRKSSIDRYFKVSDGYIHIEADQHNICIVTYPGKIASYRFILWLKDSIYIIIVEQHDVFKVVHST